MISRRGRRRHLVAAVGLLTIAAALGGGLGGLPTPAGKSTGHQSAIGSGRGGVARKLVGVFHSPTDIAFAPGNPSRFYVAEQRGRIRVGGGSGIRTFLDIRGLVRSVGDRGAGIEQGLNAIAFAPDFRQTRRFYVTYSNANGDFELDQFRAGPGGAHGILSSRRRVLVIRHPDEDNHYSGELQFQPNGLLFITVGDGGGVGDPSENAQNTTTLLGKLLRIDPTVHGDRPYGVPFSNPFVHRPGRDEIYALGLRNPWRFSFDRATGNVLIADVGQANWEEVDYETMETLRGANFGWDRMEGRHRYDSPLDEEAALSKGTYQAPIYEYSHKNGRCAITGGYVVRNGALDSLIGRYVYADYCTGELRSLVPRIPGAIADRPTGVFVPNPTAFGQAPDGRIFVASGAGPVYRLVSR